MFENYSDHARAAVKLAREETEKYSQAAVNTAHLFAGIIRQRECSGREILERCDLDMRRLSLSLEKNMSRGTAVAEIDVAFSVNVKRVFAAAEKEAQKLGASEVGTEHLLLGLLLEEKSVPALLLEKFGVDFAKVSGFVAKRAGVSAPKKDAAIACSGQFTAAKEESTPVDAAGELRQADETAAKLLADMRKELLKILAETSKAGESSGLDHDTFSGVKNDLSQRFVKLEHSLAASLKDIRRNLRNVLDSGSLASASGGGRTEEILTLEKRIDSVERKMWESVSARDFSKAQFHQEEIGRLRTERARILGGNGA